MKISEIMTRMVETVSADATIEQAARKMRTRNVGILPVVDESRLIGTVTDRDITVRAVAEGRPPHLTVIRDVMSPHAQCIFEDQSLMDASRMMQRNRIRRLMVLDRKNNFVGLLSLDDLAIRAAKEKLSGHILSKLKRPA